jgi:hypothetical protein
MGAAHIIITPKHGTGAYGRGLFSNGQMDKSGDEIPAKKLPGLFLKGPYRDHPLEKLTLVSLGCSHQYILLANALFQP